jgi:hypothetical protein
MDGGKVTVTNGRKNVPANNPQRNSHSGRSVERRLTQMGIRTIFEKTNYTKMYLLSMMMLYK